MIFKVTHIDAGGQRRRMRVRATDQGDALDQVERAFGVPWRLASVRWPVALPVLATSGGRQLLNRALEAEALGVAL